MLGFALCIDVGICLQTIFKVGAPGKVLKLKGKHPCRSHFLNKVAGWNPKTLLRKRSHPRCFLVKTLFSREQPQRLLLCLQKKNSAKLNLPFSAKAYILVDRVQTSGPPWLLPKRCKHNRTVRKNEPDSGYAACYLTMYMFLWF